VQYKVPQNIDLEDKIIGPLTLVQFVYLMTGGMIIYISFNTISSAAFYLIAIPVALLSLALTFVKVQDQSFSHFLGAFALYFAKPRKRIWHKIPEMETVKVVETRVIKKDDKKVYKGKTLNQTNLEELSTVLDTRGLGNIQGEKNPTILNNKGQYAPKRK